MQIHVHNKTYTHADDLIQDYMPFIIKTISAVTHRYVSIENDETFSIGLNAFYEASCKYDEAKGEFLPYAQLVIKSRLLTYLKNQHKAYLSESLDDTSATHIQALVANLTTTPTEDASVLADEIHILNHLLADFKFDLSALTLEAPKHEKTRTQAIHISEKVSQDPPLVSWLYLKKRLPITQIALKYQVTQKVLKGSKKFIITVIIILDKNLRNLKLWIRK